MKRKGIKTDRHIVVFESDDWGSIRMPSLEVAEWLKAQGVNLCAPRNYDKYDTLESEHDLTSLMEVLDSVRDKHGKPAKITMNYVMANPDFKKIREAGYNNFYYELFTETYKHYPDCEHSFDYLKEGIAKGMFQPQFHGREHLNVSKWLRTLRSGDYAANEAFKKACFSMALTSNPNSSVMAAFDAENEDDSKFIADSITEGLEIFERIFGFRSQTMIAPCYTWDDAVEVAANRMGVKLMQGNAIQRHSTFFSNKEGKNTQLRWIGMRNALGQMYTIRNCSYEPAERPTYDIDRCLSDIESQFRMHHPAVVTCHRENFIGSLVPRNRDKNLKDLKTMLATIVKKYPDVEFLSSDELLTFIE